MNILVQASMIIPILLASSITNFVSAAPIPATSTSKLIDSEHGTFRSNLGFSISAGNSDWILTDAPRNHKYIAIQYKAPRAESGVQAALTVRVDQLRRKSRLKSYVKKWIRDYPKLGFDILAAKKIKINRRPAFLLDLLNRESHLQLRQVVFMHKKRAVILTCRDNKERFLENLKACNNIIRSFKWTLPRPKTKSIATKTKGKKRSKVK